MKLKNITKTTATATKLSKLGFKKVIEDIDKDKRFNKDDKNNMMELLKDFTKLALVSSKHSDYHNLNWTLKNMSVRNFHHVMNNHKFSSKKQLQLDFDALDEDILDVRNQVSFANDYTCQPNSKWSMTDIYYHSTNSNND